MQCHNTKNLTSGKYSRCRNSEHNVTFPWEKIFHEDHEPSKFSFSTDFAITWSIVPYLESNDIRRLSNSKIPSPPVEITVVIAQWKGEE